MSRLPPKVIGILFALLASLAQGATVGSAKGKRPAGPGDDCLTCHSGQWFSQAVIHPPVKNGLCTACHRPASTGDHTFTYAADGKHLCRQCHAPRDIEEVKHPPVTEGLCLFCHDPHASDNLVRLRLPVFDTCTQCHPSKRIQNATSATKHGALDPAQNPKVCVACHDPHQSPYEKRLKLWPPMNVCLQCHDKVQMAPTGPLLNIKELLDANPVTELRHGPVREGKCPECHDPHGTNNWRMLKRSFPGEFYEPYVSGDSYGLCFGCHDRRLLQDQWLTEPPVSNKDVTKDLAWTERPEGQRLVRGGITGFRNGNENIHFRHVNKVDKGRTCRACHDFHASPNPKHIRPSTRFGNWEFQLNYQKTLTGGQCWPGCHVERRYDRNKKQENPR